MKRVLAAWLVLLSGALVAGCSEHIIYDGYTLHGIVKDGVTGGPIDSVAVWFGYPTQDTVRYYNAPDYTDRKGQFEYQGFPGTAPGLEIFRFEKNGYRTREVAARSAKRVERFSFTLTVRLTPLTVVESMAPAELRK